MAGLLGFWVIACADFKRGPYWDVAGAGDTAGDADEPLGYAADIHPLLDSGCRRCHAPGQSAADTGFLIHSDDVMLSYASALEQVDLDDPGASRLLTKAAGSGHGGGAIFDERSDEYGLLLAWIERGAAP